MIGYPPTRLNPHIPDFVLTEHDGAAMVLFRDMATRSCSDEERSTAISIDLRIGQGEWVVVDGRPKSVKLEDLSEWRDQAAVDLVQKAMGTKGDPLHVLNMLESAAKLRSLDLAGFVTTLNVQRSNDDESLGEVFLRVRGTREGGRTGG